MKRTLLAAVATIALTTGAAFAQTGQSGSEPEGSTEGDPGGTPMELEMQQPDMTPFFMDDSMTEIRPMEENQATFMAMPEEDQQTYRERCELAEASDPSAEINSNEVTGSVDPDTLPLYIQAFCEQMGEFQPAQ